MGIIGRMEEKIIPDFPTFAITSSGLVRDLRTGALHNGHFHDGYRMFNLTSPTCRKSFLCLLYTSPSPRDGLLSRMPSSA